MNTQTSKQVEAPINAEAINKVSELIALGEGATLKDVVKKVNELVAIIVASKAERDRGPKSSRTMVEQDAERLMLGDLKDVSHTKAAETLGLSYGQVYSARKGFTFKTIYQRALKESKKS